MRYIDIWEHLIKTLVFCLLGLSLMLLLFHWQTKDLISHRLSPEISKRYN